MLSQQQIKLLLNKYLEVFRLETEVLGCRPTEVRHLLGRIGEFYCAIETKGQLASITNQHGFDVLSPKGRRISVKTTAQMNGCISINRKTISLVEDLMVLQLVQGNIKVLYYGPINNIIHLCRPWESKLELELDLSKLKRIAA